MLRDVVVIALSASVFGEDRDASLTAGCNDFEPKPIQVEPLLEKIRTHLNLEWTYEDEAELQAQPTADDQSLEVPPLDALRPLFECAEKGEVVDVVAQIDRIEQLDVSFGPFVSRVREWTDAFQMEAICEFLKPYLEDRQ